MTTLIIILTFKILVSLILLVYPLLFKPLAQLNAAMEIEAKTTNIYRLYGTAILSLLIAYAYGVILALEDQFPGGIVAMGLVSNGGASYLMATRGNPRQKRGAILFGGIFIALLVEGLRHWGAGV